MYFSNIWKYRSFIYSSILNDFRSRYARSRIGFFWMLIHPLAQVAIYVLILSNVLAAKIPGIDHQYGYALYLLSGMVVWGLFSEIVSRSLTVFTANANLLKKVSFPRITLPTILIGSAWLNHFCLLIAALVIFSLIGVYPSLKMLSVLLLMVPLTCLAIGVGLILGVLNVFFRDVEQVVPIVLQFLFWFTPIVYPLDIVPAAYHEYFHMNPIYDLVVAYRSVLLSSEPWNAMSLFASTAVSLFFLVLSGFLFRRASPEMTDVL